MIRARKTGPLAWLVARYVDARVRGAFRGVWVRGRLPALERGTVIYANHSSFWDGFIAHALGRSAGWDLHCVMDEQQLARFRFLSRLGAFSIRRGDPASALESLRYAQRLLEGPRAVLVFPEGTMHSRRELVPLERGVEVLARAARAPCLPLAFRYAFFESELPDVLVEAGELHDPAPLAGFSGRLIELHARLARAESLDGFQRIVSGHRGLSERWRAARAGAQ